MNSAFGTKSKSVNNSTVSVFFYILKSVDIVLHVFNLTISLFFVFGSVACTTYPSKWNSVIKYNQIRCSHVVADEEPGERYISHIPPT